MEKKNWLQTFYLELELERHLLHLNSFEMYLLTFFAPFSLWLFVNFGDCSVNVQTSTKMLWRRYYWIEYGKFGIFMNGLTA